MDNNKLQIPYDNESVALLVIDMQEGFRDSANKVASNIKTLVKNCHNRNIPIFWTQHGHIKLDDDVLVSWWGSDKSVKYGSENWKILQELQPHIERSPGSLGHLDFTITSKRQYDAFYGTELNSLLGSLGIKTLIISGVMTNLCCESTARSGFIHNYNIVFLDDGCATINKEMHEATLINLRYGFATIAKINDILDWL
ncbi:Isochorismatase-like protein [Glomus cerebriforme]|uniref:Isochorismatase-like protein n=1 Tax=Glomus cerebriforme TaxID=658196 RepID=A0A397SER8_9GLOM|nr:Isochorismatase-like protein [Glomus cerebriforme]